MTFKILNSIVLLGKAHDLIEESKRAAAAKSETKATPAAQTTSKDDLELLTMPKVSSTELSGDQTVRRTQSLVDLATEKEDDEPEPSPERPSESTAYLRSSSFATNSLLYNSTVSLQSVGLYDSYVEDEKETAPTARHRETPSKDKKTEPADVQPLSEVDRYTMVCNRII